MAEVSVLDSMISTISKCLRFFRMDITKFLDEETDEPYFVFYNMVDNHLTRLAKIYSEDELEYFKLVISAIVLSPEGLVSKNSALNLRNDLTERNIAITATAAENLLTRWTKDKFLNETSVHKIGLGVKSLVELAVYLREYFPHNIVDCDLCKNVCVRGVDCSHLGVKLHRRCAQKYFSTIKNCPECS